MNAWMSWVECAGIAHTIRDMLGGSENVGNGSFISPSKKSGLACQQYTWVPSEFLLLCLFGSLSLCSPFLALFSYQNNLMVRYLGRLPCLTLWSHQHPSTQFFQHFISQRTECAMQQACSNGLEWEARDLCQTLDVPQTCVDPTFPVLCMLFFDFAAFNRRHRSKMQDDD